MGIKKEVKIPKPMGMEGKTSPSDLQQQRGGQSKPPDRVGTPPIGTRIVEGIGNVVQGPLDAATDFLFGDKKYRDNQKRIKDEQRQKDIARTRERINRERKAAGKPELDWNRPKPGGGYYPVGQSSPQAPAAPKPSPTPSASTQKPVPNVQVDEQYIIKKPGGTTAQSGGSMRNTGRGTARTGSTGAGRRGGARTGSNAGGAASGSTPDSQGLFAMAREIAERKAETGQGGLQSVQDKAYAQYGFKMVGGKLVNTMTGRSAEDTREAQNRAQDLAGRLRQTYDSHFEMARSNKKPSARVEDPNYE